jgi:hypothetical protein
VYQTLLIAILHANRLISDWSRNQSQTFLLEAIQGIYNGVSKRILLSLQRNVYRHCFWMHVLYCVNNLYSFNLIKLKTVPKEYLDLRRFWERVFVILSYMTCAKS